jgi:hypothetical protein
MAYGCFVDEMKSFFGLPKQGTHWFRSGANVKIIYPVEIKLVGNQMAIIEFPKLKEFMNLYSEGKIYCSGEMTNTFQANFPDLSQKIRISFAFRLIFGQKQINKSSITIKWSPPPQYTGCSQGKEWVWDSVSVDETTPVDPGIDNELSSSISDYWFGQQTINHGINQTVKEMCKIWKFEEIKEYLLLVGNQIEQTINRIDKRLISHGREIIQRLTTRLMADIRSKPSTEIAIPCLNSNQEIGKSESLI